MYRDQRPLHLSIPRFNEAGTDLKEQSTRVNCGSPPASQSERKALTHLPSHSVPPGTLSPRIRALPNRLLLSGSKLGIAQEVSASPTWPTRRSPPPPSCSQLWVPLRKSWSLWTPSLSPASPGKSTLYRDCPSDRQILGALAIVIKVERERGKRLVLRLGTISSLGVQRAYAPRWRELHSL